MTKQVNLHDTKGDDWDKLAEDYVKIANGPTVKVCSTLINHANATLPFKDATAILDNGCGPGVVMNQIIENYGNEIPSSCELDCADFSDGMIAQCQKQKDAAASDSPWSRVRMQVQNAMDLSNIDSDSKSHVTAGFVYFMTPDPAKCLAESKRVLKEGGVLAASSWETSQWMDVMNLMAKVRPDKVMPSIPKEWNTAEALAKEFERAGFRDVQAHQIPTSMTVTSYEGMADLFTSKMPHMVMMQKDMSEEEKAEYRRLVIEKIQEMCPSVPGELQGVALAAVGRK